MNLHRPNKLDYGIGILGTGKCLPEKVLLSSEVEARNGLPPGTIVQKTGVARRHIASDQDSASEMSARAARQALERANLSADRLGLILGCTFTGDYVYPAMACKVHQLLGAKNAAAFDLMANCTGFQVGLSVASDKMLLDPEIEYGLVLGTALQSRFINWRDPNSSLYFGDGAGAAILGRVPAGYGVLATDMFTNSQVYDSVRMRGGGSSFPITVENVNDGLQFYEINGMEVWKQVMQNQPTVIKRVLRKIGKSVEDVDFFVFHQANLNLIEFMMTRMKQPLTKTYTNVQDVGNTAEASIPIALHDAVDAGCLKRDQLVVISGVGAGFTFGATVLRWY